MRRASFVTLAMALQILLLLGVAHSQTTTTYHSSGAYAEAVFYVNGSYVDLFVARGCASSTCPNPNIGTYIVWHSFGTNPDGSSFFTEGDGTIPDNAFQSSTLQHMSLNIDTSQVPGFNTTTCNFTPGVGPTGCHSGPFGVMQADWQETKANSSNTKTDTTTTEGPFTTKAHVDANMDSANATGSFLGATFNSSNGTVGSNNDHTTSITKAN